MLPQLGDQSASHIIDDGQIHFDGHYWIWPGKELCAAELGANEAHSRDWGPKIKKRNWEGGQRKKRKGNLAGSAIAAAINYATTESGGQFGCLAIRNGEGRGALFIVCTGIGEERKSEAKLFLKIYLK